MSLVAISGNASGTGTLTIAAPNTNSNYTLTLPTNTGTIVTNKTAGTVLQVVSTNYNTRTSFTSTTSLADITGMTVTITPTSTTSKIFVLVTLSFNASGGQNVFCILDRNGTRLAEGAAGEKTFIGMATANSNNYWMLSATNSFLDSPASTSALTYKLQARTAASTSTWVINGTVRNDASDPNGSSTITVMEIAA